MRRWFALLGNDLRRRIRNRSAIISAVVAPLAMGVVFSVLVSGGAEQERVIGVALTADSEASREVRTALTGAQDGPVEFRAVESAELARAQVDDDELDAAIVLPAGFGGPEVRGELVVLTDPDRQVSGGIAESVANQLSQRSAQVATIAGALGSVGAVPDEATLGAAGELDSLLQVIDDPERGELDAGAYFGASMSIIFMFFTVGYLGTSLHVERRTGTLARVLASPTSVRSVVTAKAASVALIGFVGFCVVWAVTSLVFGANWGPPLLVLVTIGATTAAVTGVAIFSVSLARTEQQTEAITGAVAFTLAILGGNFIGPGQAPELLARLSVLTPNGWALTTFSDLSTRSADVAQVARSAAALCAFAVLFGVIGLVRVSRMVAR